MSRQKRIRQSIKIVNQAYDLTVKEDKKSNAMVLNILANHMFNKFVPTGVMAEVKKGSATVEIVPGEGGDAASVDAIFATFRSFQRMQIGHFVTNIVSVNAADRTLEIERAYPDEDGQVKVSKKNSEPAINLANNARYATEVNEIRAESCYIIGRAYHSEGQYDRARDMYRQSTKFWPEYPLPHFGYGQMLLEMGEIATAIKEFESVLEKESDCYEAHLILGSLLASEGRDEAALVCLKRVIELTTKGWQGEQAYTEMAQLLIKATAGNKVIPSPSNPDRPLLVPSLPCSLFFFSPVPFLPCFLPSFLTSSLPLFPRSLSFLHSLSSLSPSSPEKVAGVSPVLQTRRRHHAENGQRAPPGPPVQHGCVVPTVDQLRNGGKVLPDGLVRDW